MRSLKLIFAGLFILMSVSSSYAQFLGFNEYVETGYNATSMLVFPSPIERTDYGSADLLVKQDKKEGCVLKLKAAKENFAPTNLTVFTKDGLMYSLRICYSDNPLQLLFELGGKDSCKAEKMLHDKGMNIVKIRQLSELIAKLPYYTGYRVVKKGGIRMYLQKIFIKEDIMFFVFGISNTTNIPYDIKLTRFSIRDKKQKRRSTEMEEEVTPLNQYLPNIQRIGAKTKETIVIAVNKVTIADHKQFLTEVIEANGDRGIRLKLSGNTLLRSVPF